MDFLFKMKEMVVNTLSTADYFGTVRQYVTEAQSFLANNEKASCDAKLSKLLDYVENFENAIEILTILQIKTLNKTDSVPTTETYNNEL